MLREALEALSPEDSPLRARLLARLSLELIFSDEIQLTDPLSRQAVEMARRLGNAAALGPALAARWMAVWGPDGLAERAAVADEIVQLAQETGDRGLEVLGRAQRIATSLESGDFLGAEADLAAYAGLVDELRMPVHQWVLTTMRAMRALLQGAFDEAERLADEAIALQPERPNARWAHVMEMAQLRWDQGRLGEVRETWQTLVERYPRASVGRGWLALADVERGDHEAARRELRIAAEQIPHGPRMGLCLQGLAVASLVAAQLDDASAARRLYPVLLPYADHVIAMNMEHPVVCFGAASLYLALLATATSSWEAASDHFEAAIRVHERLGAAPLLARTRYEYARMLLLRGEPADRARASECLERAATSARALGMAGLGAQAGRLMEAAAQAAPASPSPPPADTPSILRDAPTAPAPLAPGRDRFQREGTYWTISYDGSVV